jgi:BirA family transcriptional regulator, biotin operon repressor / biotin---[acetyl-CoA-carboxylase] ligase
LKSNLSEGDLRGSHDTPPDVCHELERVRERLGSIGRRIHWFETTGSTNDVAASLAQHGADEGTTVVAESQTAGRGRHGRVWFSPPGAGLYVSVVLRPHAMTGDDPAALLTLAAGVAIADAVQAATGLPAEIKWPNDVIVGGRKLAGILAEAAMQGGVLQFVVLGFGVNLRAAAYPADLAGRVTSIEAETSRPPDRALVLGEILAALSERYADLGAERFDAILSAWRRLAKSLLSARVEWDSPTGVVRGRAEDIDDRGRLLVRVGQNVERVVAGEVRWI